MADERVVQGLLPLMVYFFLRNEIPGGMEEHSSGLSPASSDKARAAAAPSSASTTALVVLTSSAVMAIFTPTGSQATLALGLSCTVLTAFAILIVGKITAETQTELLNGGASVTHASSGLSSQPLKAAGLGIRPELWIKDVSAAAALTTGLATLALENFTFGGLAYWGIIGQVMGDSWVFGQSIVGCIYGVGIVGVHCVMYWALLMMVSSFIALYYFRSDGNFLRMRLLRVPR